MVKFLANADPIFSPLQCPVGNYSRCLSHTSYNYNTTTTMDSSNGRVEDEGWEKAGEERW